MSTLALDRPVWNMLTGPRQFALASASGAAVRINPLYGPFAASRDDGNEAQAALGEIVRLADGEVWVVEPEAWPAPPAARVVRSAALLQMIAPEPAPQRPGDQQFTALGEPDAAEMAMLAHATQPGPWGSMTHLYGQFFGYRDDGRLVAMAGERMLPASGLAEVSGVCTVPEYRGRGLAGQLIRRVMANQLGRGDTPFLHSYAGNDAAIGLYRSLGFKPRRDMVVTVLTRA